MVDKTSDPHHHTQKMRARLHETIDHLRKDIEEVDEPKFRAKFETAAEVLGGLERPSRTTRRGVRRPGADGRGMKV